jgi:hypothetical protein
LATLIDISHYYALSFWWVYLEIIRFARRERYFFSASIRHACWLRYCRRYATNLCIEFIHFGPFNTITDYGSANFEPLITDINHITAGLRVESRQAQGHDWHFTLCHLTTPHRRTPVPRANVFHRFHRQISYIVIAYLSATADYIFYWYSCFPLPYWNLFPWSLLCSFVLSLPTPVTIILLLIS